MLFAFVYVAIVIAAEPIKMPRQIRFRAKSIQLTNARLTKKKAWHLALAVYKLVY